MAKKANKDMPTVAKTYMFYHEDVIKMLNKDLQPKHVLRMGLKAIEGNPEILDRLNETQDDYKTLSERVYRIAKALDIQCQKNEALEKKLIELGVKLDDVQ